MQNRIYFEKRDFNHVIIDAMSWEISQVKFYSESIEKMFE